MALHSKAAIVQTSSRAPEGFDPELCYRALASRDVRFDGRFFTGVVTTGVYCRPICPAPTPRQRNVRFYACAAAAEAAGFRPCLRCRPEASPGTPAWLGTSATVSRALRHIAAGALNESSVEELSERLGIGERHLRRLFLQHLGASPLAVAQTQRIHLAKALIEETALSMTHVAFDAGFASIRRFNAAIKKAYGKSPTELRRPARSTRQAASTEHLTLRLPFRPPLDWDLLLGFLGPRAIPGVEQVDGRVYRRTIRVEDAAGVIEVQPSGERPLLVLRVPNSLAPGIVRIVHGVRRLFDLGADPLQIGEHLSRSRLLRRRVQRHPGLRVPGAWDPFETAARVILGQQISVQAATTLAGRLAQAFGERLEAPNGQPQLLFPTAGALAAADLTSIGLPRARAEALRSFAAGVERGAVRLDASRGLETFVAELEGLPGVGRWTAHCVAMRALGEPDAFLESDLGVRRAFSRHGESPSPREILQTAEVWRPWRSYATMYLWLKM